MYADIWRFSAEIDIILAYVHKNAKRHQRREIKVGIAHLQQRS